jgi:hypothetical protein
MEPSSSKVKRIPHIFSTCGLRDSEWQEQHVEDKAKGVGQKEGCAYRTGLYVYERDGRVKCGKFLRERY